MVDNIILPTLENQLVTCWEIRVRGTVQGVGFRPTVFKLATEYGIRGSVLNDGEGVLIKAWASESDLAEFIQSISAQSPPLAKIESIEHSVINLSKIPSAFAIERSSTGESATNISADAAVCNECLDDVFDPLNRRFRYPFTNCTHCGPRFSIISAIPYDRASTSMAVFAMCENCQKEYDDPSNRRFHAQPNACHACGPKVWLETVSPQPASEIKLHFDPIEAAARLIEQGAIVAIKGIGGFHLACDATNEETVHRMRQRKHRYEKPFALMARNVAMIESYCLLNPAEAKIIAGTAAPIVVLKTARNETCSSKQPASHAPVAIAPSVAPGQNSLGFMLPYTPLHHLLFEHLKQPIVLTSGNRAEEPQCIDNDSARKSLALIADYILMHNREIVNRLDDSVARVDCDEQVYLRRGRGVAPNPIPLPPGFEDAPDLLAMGSELKNSFCLIKNGKAIVSQHLGDLEEANTFNDYQHNLVLYKDLYRHKATQIAVDLHPDYLSSKLGRAIAAEEALPLVEIQHHHAHVASCLADNGYPLSEGPVLGIALDGLGFGSDGSFWGGEFLLADYHSFELLGRFKPVALLGGYQAMKEPWRNTYAHLMACMDWQSFKTKYNDLELTNFFETKPLGTLNKMLESQFNSPPASSCGRLFDAVAAALDICRHHASYEGQAAIELEAIVNVEFLEELDDQGAYVFDIACTDDGACSYIESKPVWQAILDDLQRRTDRGVIAARFHRALAKAIVIMAKKLSNRGQEKQLATIALSGGVFQNKILEKLVQSGLRSNNFKVLTHRQVPANDGGLALGQAIICAALQLRKK